jgi:glycine cleavage system H protein
MPSRRPDPLPPEESQVIPDELLYTAEHEWVSPTDDAPVRVGITDFAQEALGDIVYVQLPDPGTAVQAGEAMGEVESTKSVSEIYSPVAGTVVSRNDQLADAPELINTDPYGAGWMVEIQPADPAALEDLLDADGYRELVEK